MPLKHIPSDFRGLATQTVHLCDRFVSFGVAEAVFENNVAVLEDVLDVCASDGVGGEVVLGDWGEDAEVGHG